MILSPLTLAKVRRLKGEPITFRDGTVRFMERGDARTLMIEWFPPGHSKPTATVEIDIDEANRIEDFIEESIEKMVDKWEAYRFSDDARRSERGHSPYEPPGYPTPMRRVRLEEGINSSIITYIHEVSEDDGKTWTLEGTQQISKEDVVNGEKLPDLKPPSAPDPAFAGSEIYGSW